MTSPGDQICAVFGVSLNYLNKAITLSPATREAVSRGQVPLSDIPHCSDHQDAPQDRARRRRGGRLDRT